MVDLNNSRGDFCEMIEASAIGAGDSVLRRKSGYPPADSVLRLMGAYRKFQLGWLAKLVCSDMH
ncbi:hypothetical protein D9M72_504810 [compost metagenome]